MDVKNIVKKLNVLLFHRKLIHFLCFQREGLDNNNSFYCPSTSGGAGASCCTVSLHFNLWRKTKREGGREGRGEEMEEDGERL